MKLPEGEVFCTTYDECAAGFPDTMSKWDAFFQVPALLPERLPALPSLPFLENYNHIFSLSLSVCLKGVKALGGSRLPEGEKKDSLLGLYWAAEMASVASSSSACKSRSPVITRVNIEWE